MYFIEDIKIDLALIKEMELIFKTSLESEKASAPESACELNSFYVELLHRKKS